MYFGLFGKMGVRPGRRDAVVEILLRDVRALRDAGCHLYVVHASPEEPDAVWVSEVWDSREAHRASLRLPSVKAAIAEAMPLLTGEFEGTEFEVPGGLGLPDPAP